MKTVSRQNSRQDVVDKVEVSTTSPFVTVSDLPSKFLPYPENSKIRYKPYSYGELEQISSTADPIEKINLVLEGIETNGFMKRDLDYQDFIFIMVLRKLSSFSSSQFIFRFNCIECDHHNVITQKISNIEFTEIKDVPSLPCVVNIDGTDVEFYTLSVGSVVEMLSKGITNHDKSTVTRLAYMANMAVEDAYELISNCTDGETIQTLDVVNSLLNFGGSTTVCKCTSCGKDAKITLRGVAKIAEPFRVSEELIRNRIVFGKERNS
jgi:hypothetical protein